MKKYSLPQTGLFCFVSTLLLVTTMWVRAEIIGDSISEFSGVQGSNSWFYGYRAFTTESAPINYDPVTDFIPFAGGEGQGAWNGSSQLWTGSAWDLNTAAAAPWTFIAQTNLHPNGINSGTIHWAIRRWYGEELFGPTAVAITWHVRKQGSGGNGVTGAIHVNGVRVDSAAIAGNNTIGVYRTYYINADFGTLVDLVLDPRGPDGLSQDGSDGSFNWMVVDTTIPEIPRQPDGSLFIPANAPDTDSDGLPDVWEQAYVGNLTQLSATGDYDGDGLLDPEELARGTDPTKTDTDNDGLTDAVETNTGVFWDVTNTGTNPLKPDTDGDGRTDGAEVLGSPTSNPLLTDTDGDGFSDGDEVSTGHNPNDPANNRLTTLIANSTAEFSGVQGQNNWSFGYRNVSADGAGVTSYNPATHFIPFAGGAGQGDWNGTTQIWTGNAWDLNTAAAAPWTVVGDGGVADNSHPNGPSPVHWAIRRWVANELTEPTAVALRWHVRKVNLNCGNGVTGGVYVNGQRADTFAIAGNNGTGVLRTYYANLNPGDIVDLIHSPTGTDGGNADGCDGSALYLHVDPTIPSNPRQPDGTPFIPINAGDSDADGIADAWEEIYFPGDLTKLSRFGDYEGDGLTDLGEFERGSNPTVADTDGDGLLDRVETKTGVFVNANNTGSDPADSDTDNDDLSDSAEVNGSPATNPNREDTDGDGFSDPAELADGTDPTNPADNPLTYVIADSASEFSGVQGQKDWYNGYRNYSLDGGGNNYDADTAFIPYPGGAGLGPWDGINQAWQGGGWNLNSSGSGPWTSQSSLDIHPNGVNSTPNQEHWATRRWVATELSDVTPAVIIWRVAKANPNGSGVTGSLHVDGQQVDFKAIAGNDTANPTRRYYVNVQPGAKIDLALTPVGPNGDRTDGADGSITWFRVDTRIPREPRQPDGSLFIPANAQDSDGDGLLDFWELIYATDLATFTGTGDNDGDGLNNQGEFDRDANPLVADTDGDGLVDSVETGTGVFVSDSNTGTSPRQVDSDGDGFADGVEVNLGKDPNDPASNLFLANSITEFSSNQGQNDWFFGYRNLTADGGNPSYDPDLQFIQFQPFMFDQGSWFLNPPAWTGNPWTMAGAELTHPNGANSGGGVHWPIRRWVANELTRPTPVAVHWHVRKENAGCGNGVSGAIYLNGVLVDSSTVAFDNTTGTTRTYYLNLNPGDAVDLASKADGTHGDFDGGFLNDWCDGSFLWMKLDTLIPPNPTQPDGTPFVPVNALPTVNITSPANGATLSAGTSATITADADDVDGRVLRVEFFAAGVGSLGVDLAAPWELTIPSIPVGTFVLTAVATDNLGGSTTSDPITVTVVANRPPVCQGGTVTTLEDVDVDILLVASDPDGDPLIYLYHGGHGPFHGWGSVSGNVAHYNPDPDYNGPDQFQFVAVDPTGAMSAPCTIDIMVTPVNDPPVCSGASATVCEDQAVDIVLPASDVDGDALSYWIVDPPANGTVSVSGNVATYQGNLNYSGPDSFTFKVTDPAGAESAPCTVSVTVQPGNDTPVGVIKVTPTVDLGPTVSGINVLSPNNVGACVTLDATQSSDADNAFSDLSFTWLVNGVVVGTGPVLADVCLLVGENDVTLLVNDGTTAASACDQPAEGTSTVMVNVMTGAEATEELVNQIYDSSIERKNKQQFIASCKTSAAAFERGSFGAGMNMLKALINKFEAQLKGNPDVQADWIERTQNIIDGLSKPVTCDGCDEAP